MWTRRVLLATVIAAAAMSLPRHVSSSNDATASAFQGLMVASHR